MVKKIDGKNSSLTRAPSPVESSKSISTSKVSSAGQVTAAQQKAKAARSRRPTRPMTAQEREHLFRLIHEEADKMFGPNGLPESQRNTVEGAVKMAIDASIVDEEDEETPA